MRDLAACLTDLAELLGHDESVHFQEVREGSVEVAYDVDSPSVEPVTCGCLMHVTKPEMRQPGAPS